jgi:hypothetical protein
MRNVIRFGFLLLAAFYLWLLSTLIIGSLSNSVEPQLNPDGLPASVRNADAGKPLGLTLGRTLAYQVAINNKNVSFRYKKASNYLLYEEKNRDKDQPNAGFRITEVLHPSVSKLYSRTLVF